MGRSPSQDLATARDIFGLAGLKRLLVFKETAKGRKLLSNAMCAVVDLFGGRWEGSAPVPAGDHTPASQVASVVAAHAVGPDGSPLRAVAVPLPPGASFGFIARLPKAVYLVEGTRLRVGRPVPCWFSIDTATGLVLLGGPAREVVLLGHLDCACALGMDAVFLASLENLLPRGRSRCNLGFCSLVSVFCVEVRPAC